MTEVTERRWRSWLVWNSRWVRDSRGQRDKEYRRRVRGRERHQGWCQDWVHCVLASSLNSSLIDDWREKRAVEGWGKRGENRQGQEQLDESVLIKAFQPEEDQSATTGKMEVRKSPLGGDFVSKSYSLSCVSQHYLGYLVSLWLLVDLNVAWGHDKCLCWQLVLRCIITLLGKNTSHSILIAQNHTTQLINSHQQGQPDRTRQTTERSHTLRLRLLPLRQKC